MLSLSLSLSPFDVLVHLSHTKLMTIEEILQQEVMIPVHLMLSVSFVTALISILFRE